MFKTAANVTVAVASTSAWLTKTVIKDRLEERKEKKQARTAR